MFSISGMNIKSTLNSRVSDIPFYPCKHIFSFYLNYLDNKILSGGHKKAFITKAIRSKEEITMAKTL